MTIPHAPVAPPLTRDWWAARISALVLALNVGFFAVTNVAINGIPFVTESADYGFIVGIYAMGVMLFTVGALIIAILSVVLVVLLWKKRSVGAGIWMLVIMGLPTVFTLIMLVLLGVSMMEAFVSPEGLSSAPELPMRSLVIIPLVLGLIAQIAAYIVLLVALVRISHSRRRTTAPQHPGLQPQYPGLPPQQPGLQAQQPGLQPQQPQYPGLQPQQPAVQQYPGLPPQQPGVPPQQPGLEPPVPPHTQGPAF